MKRSRSFCEITYDVNKMAFLQIAAGLGGQSMLNVPSSGANPPATATERASRSVFGTYDLNHTCIGKCARSCTKTKTKEWSLDLDLVYVMLLLTNVTL